MPHVLCNMNTRCRWETTLPIALQAIISQTRPPDEFLLIDDSPPEGRPDMWKHPILGPLFQVIARRTKLTVINGPGRGQHHCHEFARTCPQSKELIWRVDDDEAPEQDCLARLEKHMEDPQVGAAAGLVLGCSPIENPNASSDISEIFCRQNVQWYLWKGDPVFPDVGHLHSSYLYRKEAGSFPLTLSPVAHTEETQHSMRIRLSGFRLVIDTGIKTWHYRQPGGGIRSQQGDYDGDRKQFLEWCETLNIKFKKRTPVVAGQGWGDCFCLMQALPDIIQAHEGDDSIHVFVRPELVDLFKPFESGIVTVVPIAEMALWGFQGEFNIYCWMGNHPQFKGNLVEAYRQRYMEKAI